MSSISWPSKGDLVRVVLYLALAGLLYKGVEGLLGTAVDNRLADQVRIPFVIVGGVLALLLVVLAVAIFFKLLDLSDRSQALALPEGSIRAIIALSLVVLFATLAVYLYIGISGSTKEIQSVNAAARDAFLDEKPRLPGLQITLSPKSTASEQLYDVSYRMASPSEAVDFAKQLLVLLGTLMTAVTSFYLGARTATAPADKNTTAPPDTTTTAPATTLKSVAPTTAALAGAAKISLALAGANLGGVKQVWLVLDKQRVPATDVKATPDGVTCDVATASLAAGVWDIAVGDGKTDVASLPKSLTLT